MKPFYWEACGRSAGFPNLLGLVGDALLTRKSITYMQCSECALLKCY
jgi:hypothetical protein